MGRVKTRFKIGIKFDRYSRALFIAKITSVDFFTYILDGQ